MSKGNRLSVWLSVDETGFYEVPLNCVVIAADEAEARRLVEAECQSRALEPGYFTLRPVDMTKSGLHALYRVDMPAAVEGDEVTADVVGDAA